jgi:type IV pilus assembly protein PilO
MALLPTDQRSQIMMLLVLVAAAGGYFFWTKVQRPQSARLTAAHQEADSLAKIIEAAKADLAAGTVDDLRRKVEEYQGSLELMRRLVPDRNEVPTLIDDISTKAKVRGVTLGKIQPLTPEIGATFDTYRYKLEVYGHYDQIGEYLADIASLQRIVVPQDVIMSSATPATQKLLGDTAGALLLAEFTLRTFVKASRPAPPPGAAAAAGAPRARP